MSALTRTRALFSLVAALTILLMSNGGVRSSAQTATLTGTATSAATTPAIDCDSSATPAATESLATPAATHSPTPVVLATQDSSAPIHFVSFVPTDLHFNPTPDKPVAIVMVFSLVFQNQRDTPLHIESPRFNLAINGVPWGQLSSTDFQTGTMPAKGEQGIVLQNLTLISKLTPAQAPLLTCLKNHHPVDLTLNGTMQAFPGDVQQSVTVRLTTPNIMVRERRQAD